MNTDKRGRGKAQTVNTLSKIELQARRAESQSKAIETQARTAETQARKAEIEFKAHIHKATVEADLAKEYRKKAATESESRTKCREAEITATQKRSHATAKKNEAMAKAQPYRIIAATKKAEVKQSKSQCNTASAKDKATNTKGKVEARQALKVAQEAEAKACVIEAGAKEAEAEARKAESELKKAKLELEEVIDAIALITKHTEAAAQAEAQAKAKQTEVDDRRAEAEARRAQSAAKMAEVKALRTGDVATAEDCNTEARMHKAKAIAQQALIKEKQDQAKQGRAKTAYKQDSEGHRLPLDQLPSKRARLAEKKHLSADGLLSTVHEVFQKIQDQERGNQGKEAGIKLSDCLMSGLAIFGLKYPSLLQFDADSREGGCIEKNLHSLYKIDQVPSDTYMRERLDVIDPINLRPAFKKLFAHLQRGKELEAYTFLDGHYLVAGDGTGFFSSKTIHCSDCCMKCHRDGSVSYYHQMMSAAIVHPNHATVIPFCPEAVINTDGSTKNDCEKNASARLYRHIRREHPHLPLIITEDALGSNGPHIRVLNELNMRFILVVKPDGNKSLFEFLKDIKHEEYCCNDEELHYKIQYVNSIPLNDSHPDLNVNFLEAWVHDKNGNLVYHNTWVTDIPITRQNAYRLYQGGRAKWKIENETFNTLKNQGYHFEHNFGHGNKHLSTIFALLMFLAFLIDQIQQSCCGLFQAAWEQMGSKVRLWGRLRAYFITMVIKSWSQLWQGIAFGIQAGDLIPIMPFLNTS